MRKLASSIWGGVGRLQTTVVGSYHAAASIRRGPVLWLILCGGFLIAAIIIGTVMMIGEFRESALRNSERELENTVRLLTHHFDQHFEDSDVIARNLISQMHFSEVASPELFKSRFSSPEAHLMLKSIGQRVVLHRGRFCRCRRRISDQFVWGLAAAGRQYRRPSLLQGL
jgi:hypothetical protein